MTNNKDETSKNNGFEVQKSCTINGNKTEIVFQRFSNRWFFLITQHGKLANLFSVQFDVQPEHAARLAVDHPEFHQSIPITITCNFGVDKDEIRSAIQFLVNKSKLNKCPSEFVISLGLKEINATTLRELVKVIDEIIL